MSSLLGTQPRPRKVIAMSLLPVPVSILDRANAREGGTAAEALAVTADRARRAEWLGYHRFWVAEHHAVPGIAGSAPTVLMAAIAARTSRIRIGSGGVMLPNHQPLVVAEQIATLQSLFPGRIDLGLGRSVGFTANIRAALRQGKEAAERFEDDLAELLDYLDGTATITARPPDRAATPPFILATGSGTEIAARTGLAVVVGGPAFRRGFDQMQEMLDAYRRDFQPSTYYPEPYVIVGAGIAVADSTEAARDILLPEAYAMAAARTLGDFPPLPPADAIHAMKLTDKQQAIIEENLSGSIHGTSDEVRERLTQLIEATGADELMVTTNTHDPRVLAATDRRLAAMFNADDPSAIIVGDRHFTVDRAHREDLPALMHMLRNDPLGATREITSTEPYVEAFSAVDADPQEFLAVARDEHGVPMGMIQVTFLPGLARAGTTRVQFEGVRVAEAVRSLGLGSALFRWAEAYAKSRGATLAQLTSDKQRPDAHRFYERLGFVPSHEGFKKTL